MGTYRGPSQFICNRNYNLFRKSIKATSGKKHSSPSARDQSVKHLFSLPSCITKRNINRTGGKDAGQQPKQPVASQNISPTSGNQKCGNQKKNKAVKYSFNPVCSAYITLHFVLLSKVKASGNQLTKLMCGNFRHLLCGQFSDACQ